MRYSGVFKLIIVLMFPVNVNSLVVASEKCEARYPQKSHEMYTIASYPAVILAEALIATEQEFGKCDLVYIGNYSLKRQVNSLVSNDGVDIAWLPATKEFSEQLLHISIPVRKGLLGWRILLVNEVSAKKLSNVKTLNELNEFTAGYSSNWSDFPVMQKNFDKLVTSPNYETLFKMLAYERFDFFSRALYEAPEELNYHKSEHPNLLIEPTIALHYKQIDLFYVNKSNTRLHERVTKGLLLMLEDGRFDKIFNHYYKKYIDQSELSSRTIIQLESPNMPVDSLFEDARLWIDPTQ